MAKFKKDYIVIENLSQYLLKEIKQFHPDDPRYIPYWKDLKKKVYEGMWGIEFGGYRYCPGRLFFYGNFGTILDVDKEQNIRASIRPLIRDVEWERSYMLLEAEGFSGWTDDDKYTSDDWYFDLKEKGLPNTATINKWREEDRKRYYAIINKDGKLKEYINPRENIRKIHDRPMGVPFYWNSTKNISEMGCLHEDTNIRMFDGSLKKAKDIVVGDKLMGPDSTTRTVQNLVRGSGVMYDVYTRYGDKYRVTDSHLHQVRKHLRLPPSQQRSSWERCTKDFSLDTNQILDIKEKSFQRDYEAIIQGVEYPEQDLKLHPYFIGYWLGDGFKREKVICYNEDDKKVIEPWFIKYANSESRFSYNIKSRGNYGLGTKKMFQFRLIDSTMLHKNNWWSKTFRNNKHIPEEYLHSSREQRLQLLAGFIDSDGNYDRSKFKVFNSDLNLIKQLQDLSRSLGFKTTLKQRQGGIKNNINYHLQITGDIHLIPTKYPRKQAKITSSQGANRNHISIDLSSGKVEDYYGFEVDKDNLFLLEDYTVTHNSRGGGKSYFYAIAVCLHGIVTDGAKYYNDDTINKPPKAEICVGSGIAGKSSDFCKKIEDAMNELAVNRNLGVWGEFGDDDYEPNIFYKEMAGSLEANNKAKKNMWRHEYKVLHAGKEITEGTGSYIAHVVYSPNKSEGAQAASGGRYNYVIYEEQGECFGEGTEIRMADGSVKKVENIVLGDYVMGHRGTPKKVINICEGSDMLYEVKQTYGQNYVVNSNHRLAVYEKYNKANTYHSIKVKDFIQWSNARKRETYGYKNNILNYHKNHLEIDPYYLGLWLGDGSTGTTYITNIDQEIEEYLKSYAEELNLTYKKVVYSDKAPTLKIIYKKGLKNPLREKLRGYGILKNKYIPVDFLYSSIEQRLQLLAGLIDSDGSISFKGESAQSYEIAVTNRPKLVDNIEFLVTSLGLKCSIHRRKNTKEDKIKISGNIHNIPVKIERKKAIKVKHKKDHLKTSIEVKEKGYGTFYGFTLENDPLFLLKDGTVVHNTVLLTKAWASNSSTTVVGARQFGIQIALGTSGNMEIVGPSKEIFTRPRDYNLVTYLDEWEESGEIGFFLPAYITATDYKDENGNTLYDEAIEHYMDLRTKAEKANNPHALAMNKMSHPMFPSDMWQQDKGNILPVAEALEREKELLFQRTFEKNYTPISLIWDSTNKYGVRYEVDMTKQPFFEYKYRYERDDLDGPVMIYEFPQEIKGEIPKDMYCYIGHDPYVSDNMDEGDSLGATYIIMNPKYALYGYSGNCIVASYIGKPWGGRKEYYGNLEKLLAFYGNPSRGLWFEANRGDECKNYFVNRNKQHLLCLRPQNIHNANIYANKITQYGYILGSKVAMKAELMDKVSEWLLEENTIGEEKKRNIERIPDIFLIRQIIAFNMQEGNYDAVMALAGAVLGIRENERILLEEINQKDKYNPLTFLSQNSTLFKNPDPHKALVKRLNENKKKENQINWYNEWELYDEKDSIVSDTDYLI